MTPVDTQKDWLLEGISPESIVEHIYAKDGFNLELIIPKDSLRELARRFLQKGYFIECHAIVDYPDRFESCYQFNRWDKVDRIQIKVKGDKANPHFPTISDIYKGANWYE